MDQITNTLLSLGWDLLGTVLALLSPLIITWLKRRLTELFDAIEVRTGLEIEAKHRDALHSAVQSAVNAVLRNGSELAADGPDKDNLVAAARDYVKRSVPDAVAALGAVDDVIVDLIKSKMRATVRQLQAAK